MCILLKEEVVVRMNRNTMMVRIIIRFVVDRISRPVFHSIVCYVVLYHREWLTY